MDDRIHTMTDKRTQGDPNEAERDDEVLSQRLRDLIEDMLDGRAPNAGNFCGNCYHPLTEDVASCRHCGLSTAEVPPVQSIPIEVIEMHRRRRGREGMVVRTIAWAGLTIGVIVALLPFVFGDVTVITVVLFFGLLAFFYIGSANLANSIGDSIGYRWGRSEFEKRWRRFVAERDA